MRIEDQVRSYPHVNDYNDKTEGRVICWWSGGVASAIAGVLALKKYGHKRCFFAYCDTKLEHPDTFRFMRDFEKVMWVKIHIFKDGREPEDIWRKVNGFNFAHGAPCSTILKREVRTKQIQNLNEDFCQIFGFDYGKKEINRAINMRVNNPDLNPVFPLIVEGYDRDKIFETLGSLGITPPSTYQHFQNNNCIGADDSEKGGCVQGGIGYWQRIKERFPKKFDYMAKLEHELSLKYGEPRTLCKDQRGGIRRKLFLKPCPHFPEIGHIGEIKGRQPVAPMECNGFCSTLDN